MRLLIFILILTQLCFAKANNLYEQLCEVNQEWKINKEIAAELGFLTAPIIENEQDLLVFHIQTLENIFLSRTSSINLSPEQKSNRIKNLKVLNEYWNRRDCPRNYYLPFRNPVFIDHEGRYCAVGYLLKADGLQKFCETVQRTSNFIFVRDVKNDIFSNWQKESGLSLEELAWIQPGYSPLATYLDWNSYKNGQIKYSSIEQSKQIFSRSKENYYNTKFQLMYWGGLLDPKADSYSNSIDPNYQGKPDFKVLLKEKKLDYKINPCIVFKNEFYIYSLYTPGIDSTTDEGSHEIFKWNNKKWEKVNYELKENEKGAIYCFFIENGKLYAGGSLINEKNGHQILLEFDGKKWTKNEIKLRGSIFGFFNSYGQKYLGVTAEEGAGQTVIKWQKEDKYKIDLDSIAWVSYDYSSFSSFFELSAEIDAKGESNFKELSLKESFNLNNKLEIYYEIPIQIIVTRYYNNYVGPEMVNNFKKSFQNVPDIEQLKEKFDTNPFSDTYLSYQNDFYIYANYAYTNAQRENLYPAKNKLLKWTQNKEWIEVDLPLSQFDKGEIYKLFEYNGKLFAAGNLYDYKENYPFILSFDGKNWQKIKTNINGTIFGIYEFDNKKYIGTIYKDWNLFLKMKKNL